MADEDNNLPVAVDSGIQAWIGTDIFSSAGLTAHAQVMKVAWGDDSIVTRATNDTPLPVKVFGLTGSLSTVTVTGAVRGLGTFTVGNTAGSPVYVTGGVNAFVYGVTDAAPVAITGAVSISSNVGITGVVNITGGRYLNSANDTVTVTGSVGKNWNLTKALDSIAVYGSDGGTAIFAKIAGSDGTVIGASGNALNVNVIGAGISATVSIGATVGIDNAAGTILKVQGDLSGTALPVTGTVTINPATVTVSNNPLFTDIRNTGLTLVDSSNFPSTASNADKLLVYHAGGVAYTIPWFLKEIKHDVVFDGSPGSISRRLNQLVTDGSGDENALYQGVKTFNSTKNAIKTWTVSINASTNSLLDPESKSVSIKHGVTIKNISTNTIKIGAGYFNPSDPNNWTEPSTDNEYGIYLQDGESIFIPNTINIFSLVASGVPPLYGKFVDPSAPTVINALAIMAV